MTTMYIILNMVQLLFSINNYNNIGGQLIISGALNNQIVVSTNNFKMPVYDNNVSSNYTPDDFHIMNPKKQNFQFLSDWIIIPSPGRYGVLSIGDVEIISGLQIILWNNIK